MDTILGMLLLLGFVWSAYGSGKRIESRKGYNVGLSRVDVTIDTSAAEAEFTGPPPGGPVPAFL